MTLLEYLSKNPKLENQAAFLEKKFLIEVYYPIYGDQGLDLIKHQVHLYNEDYGENYYIDFVVESKDYKWAIEVDGLYSHAEGKVPKEYFDKLQRKQNEITKPQSGFEGLLRYTSKLLENPKVIQFDLNRALISDPQMVNIRLGVAGTIEPHDVQKETLNALNETREQGNNKGLIVYATGVGKTYLSAFDSKSMNACKILFVVHQTEIVRQSRNSFENVQIQRLSEMGFYYGNQKELSKNIIFATIQTIGKDSHLQNFKPNHFDYIIVDETHHAAAPSYNNIFTHFKPKFFLGLTATPDRMDKKSILTKFDNNLVYEIDQKTAIEKALLVPYRYVGFKDDVDYTNIKWNGRWYNEQDLNKALMIEKRDKSILEKFNEYCAGKKVIGFCVSIEHAEHMTKLFNDHGISSVVIHSEVEKQSNITTEKLIEQFRNNKYKVAFVVNMFNEGIDIPDVDCLLFLRPTESKTIFTQQIGRGLRISPHKKIVLILDFIGNYKTASYITSCLGIDLSKPNKTLDEKQLEMKLVYYYDNNGCEVRFQDEVVDMLKELKAKETQNVDPNLISEEWFDYTSFIKDQSENNLYLKVGQQNKHIQVQLEGINIISEAPYLGKTESETTFKKKIGQITAIKYPQTGMQAGFRGLMISKILGLINAKSPLEPKSTFYEIKSLLQNNDFENLQTYIHLITRQMEKMSYWNPIFGNYNKYQKKEERVKFNVFNNYPVLFLNLLIIELKEKYGYKDSRISREEFDFFVVFAKSLSEYSNVAKFITDYRQYGEKPELRKLHRQSAVKLDSRLFDLLSYVEYFAVSKESIKLKDERVADITSMSQVLTTFIDNSSIITPEEHPDLYLKMLYSQNSFVDFHKKYQA